MPHLRLAFEPVPWESRRNTLANLLPPDQWNAIRRSAYRRGGYRCEACGRSDRLHCHEVWHFNHSTGCQCLAGLQALCPLCHDTKHITFTHDEYRVRELLQHFAAVNRLTPEEAGACLEDARNLQRALDSRQWRVSFGDYNMRVPAVRDVEARRKYAASYHPRYRV